MTRTFSLSRVATILVLVYASIGAHAFNQEDTGPDLESRALVVLLKAHLDGTETLAAGILIGSDQNAVYIATAAHAVQSGLTTADSIDITFNQDRDLNFPGEILRVSKDLDLAIILVKRTLSMPLSLVDGPLDRLGDTERLARRTQVLFTGHPNGMLWQVSVSPSLVTSVEGPWIYVETQSIAPGSSGGAAISLDGELVGMVRSDQPPLAQVLRMGEILRACQDWGVPARLRPALMRGGVHSMSVGGEHACAIDTEGVAYCWGANEAGQVGNGTAPNYSRPRRVVLPRQLSVISAGGKHTCAVAEGGELYCWGNNSEGELGIGRALSSSPPIRVDSSRRFREVSAGGGYTCAVTVIGEAVCWGNNSMGQLGIGEGALTADRPTKVNSSVQFKSISANLAGDHTCAISESNDAYCWGQNDDAFQLISESNIEEKVPNPTRVRANVSFLSVAVLNRNTCALLPQKRVACWGRGFYPSENKEPLFPDRKRKTGVIFNTPRIAAVDGGGNQMCGISTDSLLYCWGYDYGTGSMGISDSHYYPALAIKDTKFKAVSAGGVLTCALSEEGDIRCFGKNDKGQLGDGRGDKKAGRVTR
jgi:alpha-tubulin suppressor-like RCC1 family protein